MNKTRKLDVLGWARFQALVCALAGLVAGFLCARIGLFIDLATIGLNAGTALAWLAVPVMPLYFAAAGFAAGVAGAWLFNLVAEKKGWARGLIPDFVD